MGTGLAAAATYASEQPAKEQGSIGRADVRAFIDAERKRIGEAMAREDIPGAAVCLIHGGQLAWMEGFGVTDRRSERAIAPDTIFSIQSTSKNFTATAIMLAVQRGILDLDEPITAYLPDFRVRSRFEANPQEKMTLRLLLSNRAGFTHEAPVGNNYDPAFDSFEAHIRSISQTWLRFPVGERYRYSNLGFDLAGYILQARMNKPFAECMRELIFEPLGMKGTTVATEEYARRRNRALGHQLGYATVPLKTPLIPSGGVYTSARDMAAYCMFHLNRGRVHGAEQQAEGTTSRDRSTRGVASVLLRERLWNEMHGFPFGGDYSLGAIREELRYGDTNVRLLSHAGGGFGFGCVFRYCPEAGLAWVALFNRPVGAAYRFGEQLIDEVLTDRFGAAVPRLPVKDIPSIDLPAAWLHKYSGRYIGRNSSVLVGIEDGALVWRTGDTESPMRFISPDEFVIADPHGAAVSYRHFPASARAPAHLECWLAEYSLDYNDGPLDAPGPDAQAWTKYLGSYRLERWGKPADVMVVQRRNGYLYLNDTRMVVEHEPGLFFTADGEAVDFRLEPPTWRNLRLHRV